MTLTYVTPEILKNTLFEIDHTVNPLNYIRHSWRTSVRVAPLLLKSKEKIHNKQIIKEQRGAIIITKCKRKKTTSIFHTQETHTETRRDTDREYGVKNGSKSENVTSNRCAQVHAPDQAKMSKRFR